MKTLAFVFALAIPLGAAEQWLRIATPHFELYTNSGEKKGKDAILHFEQVRSFFQEFSALKGRPETPARIIAFRSEKEFKPYRINEFATAYYMGGRNRDYIVMQEISAEQYPVAIHEYAHLVIRHSGASLPIWLNEGLADLFSTLRPVGNKAVIGELIPGRVRTLQIEKWIPLGVLTAVDRNSPLYNEKNKAGMFYAESWALTHMLRLAPEYDSGFRRFFTLIASGKEAAEAFQTIYGKPMTEVEKDLRTYFQRRNLYAGAIDVKLEKSAENPEISTLKNLSADLVLANLFAAIHKPDQAREIYDRLAKEHPENAEIEEAYGYLAWESREEDKARTHFSRALAAGTNNPQMCYQYALMEGDQSAAAVSALERALVLKPDFTEARLQLGIVLMQQRNYAGSRAHLLQIAKVEGDQAFRLFWVLARADLELHLASDARKNAELAKKWAKGPHEVRLADELLEYLKGSGPLPEPERAGNDSRPDAAPRMERRPASDSAERPLDRGTTVITREKLERAAGKVTHLECLGANARLHLATEQGTLLLDVPDPGSIILKRSSGTGPLEFNCGPQKPFPVEVEYLPKADTQSGTAGILRVVQF